MTTTDAEKGRHPIAPTGDHRDMGVLTDEEIYRKHADELIRFAQGLVGRVDAADVVSAAVVQSISTPRWPSVRNHRAYLYRAVLNQAKKTHRDRQRRWDKELRAGAPAARSIPEVHPEVLDAVRHLSPQQRAVVVLTYWDDMAPDEVAEMLSVSEGSVRKQLARSRAKLRKVLA